MTRYISNWPRHIINSCPKAIGPSGPPNQLRAAHHQHRLLSSQSQKAPTCLVPHIQASVPTSSLHQPHPSQVVLTPEAKQTTHTLVPKPLCQPTLIFPGLVASGMCLGCGQVLMPCALENPTLQEEKAVAQVHPKQGAHRTPGLKH